jgi:hypothetical protein
MAGATGSLSYRLMASWVVIPAAGGLQGHPFGPS